MNLKKIQAVIVIGGNRGEMGLSPTKSPPSPHNNYYKSI